MSPSAIVHDLRMSIPIAAQAAGVGCASICHQPLFVGFAHPGLPVNSLWTQGIDGFNDVISAVGWTPVRADLRELFTRTPMIVPSTPEFDPMTPEMPVGTTHYVGPLVLPFDGPAGDVAAVAPNSLLFYRVVGGASFDEFKRAFADLGDRVVIASGSERSADHLRAGSAGLGFRVEPLWNLTDILPRTSVAIHHGGPGITLNCISAAVPAVGLPGNHPDRCLYSDALQALGLGRSLSASASLGASWQSAVDTTGLMPPWQEVRESIEGLAGDRQLARRLRQWSRRLGQRGSDDLLGVVERLPVTAA